MRKYISEEMFQLLLDSIKEGSKLMRSTNEREQLYKGSKTESDGNP